MGIIRTGIVLFLGVILIGTLFATNLFWVLSASINIETIKENSDVFVENFVSELDLSVGDINSQVEENFPTMEEHCLNNDSDFVFIDIYSNTTFLVSCDVIAEGPEAVVEAGFEQALIGAYNKNSGGVFSDKTVNFFRNNFLVFLVISLLIISVLFLFFDKKSNYFIFIGVLIVFVSFPFSKINLFEFIVPLEFSSVFDLVVEVSYNLFLFSAFVGLFLLATGVSLKFWKNKKLGGTKE